jgi:hypothetical protein
VLLELLAVQVGGGGATYGLGVIELELELFAEVPLELPTFIINV